MEPATVRPPERPIERPVLTPIGRRQGPGWGTLGVALVVMTTLGVLGRFVPTPEAAAPPASSVAGAPVAGATLVSPFSDVLYRRTTEVAVQGTAPAATMKVDIVVIVDGRQIGETQLAVDPAGGFGGLVPIIPPKARSVAVLEVRDPATGGRLLAQASFAVQANSLILPREPSMLRGTAGSTMIVDVLIYGPLKEVRGLLTSVDGRLIASGSTRVGPPVAGVGWPRTIVLELEIPLERVPALVRLHVMAIDRAGTELEHIDANVVLSNT